MKSKGKSWALGHLEAREKGKQQRRFRVLEILAVFFQYVYDGILTTIGGDNFITVRTFNIKLPF